MSLELDFTKVNINITSFVITGLRESILVRDRTEQLETEWSQTSNFKNLFWAEPNRTESVTVPARHTSTFPLPTFASDTVHVKAVKGDV